MTVGNIVGNIKSYTFVCGNTGLAQQAIYDKLTEEKVFETALTLPLSVSAVRPKVKIGEVNQYKNYVDKNIE